MGGVEKAKAATQFAKRNLSSVKANMDPRTIVFSIFSVWAISVLTFFTYVKQFLEPFFRLFFASRHPVVVRTPEDRFVALGLEGLGYTFASNYIDIPLGAGKAIGHPRMHYLDECAGDKEAARETVLCLHGEPTWSFLYRKMIPTLVQAGYRVVVPDMIGFGKSDKYVDMENYNHEIHTFAVKHLIKELGLGDNITLVAQDWGGITGLSVLKDIPDKFSHLVLMNTLIPTGFVSGDPVGYFFGFLPFMLWRSFVAFFGTRLPVELLLRRSRGFGAAEVKAYGAPFPGPAYKAGVAKWPLMVPIFRDDPVAQHMIEVKSCLRAWQKPALLMWGDKDPITKMYEPEFVALLPNAKRIPIKGAGHFPQESHGELLAENVVKFLDAKM